MVRITHEMLKDANTYVPLLEKTAVAEVVAEKCVMPVHVGYKQSEDEKSRVMPNSAQEIPYLTNLCLMGILATKYLKQGDAWGDDIQMPANLYDEWGASHVMNQLERLKTDKAVSRIVYDLLYDFKEFRWMIRKAIDARVQHQSDVVCRMHQILKDDIFGLSDLTPDMLAETIRNLEGREFHVLGNETQSGAEDKAQMEGGS